MQRPVRIPEGKSSIIGKAVCLVNTLIQPFILAIDIHVSGWIDERMIQSRVEIDFVIF